MTSLAARERAALCDLFTDVGPDAPTLCEGWTTADLAAHLWVRENQPLATAAAIVPAFGGVADERRSAVLHRLGYRGVVAALREGPAGVTPYRIPGVDSLANTAEFFIHHEDVRRAGEHPQGPRPMPMEDQDRLWPQVRLLGRLALRHSPVGVVVERPDGESLRLRPGTRTVTLLGQPGELLLALSGRGDAADVTVLGEDDAVAEFLAMPLSL